VVEKLALIAEFDGRDGRMSDHQFSVVVASPRDPLIRF